MRSNSPLHTTEPGVRKNRYANATRALSDDGGGSRPTEQTNRWRYCVSEITVKVHCGRVMRKMRVSSLPDLARMADKLSVNQ